MADDLPSFRDAVNGILIAICLGETFYIGLLLYIMFGMPS